MDAGIWLQLCAVLVAAGAAVFTFVQAKVAADSRDDARAAQDAAEAARDEALELSRKATAAAERQAAAQEEANRLEIEARTPPTWTGPEYVNTKVRAMVNTSGEPLLIEEVVVIPDGHQGFVRVQDGAKLPFEVPVGGQLRYFHMRSNLPGADLVVVKWRRLNQSDLNELRLTLL